MGLTITEHTIIQYMAKTMFAVAWADYQEQVLGHGLQGEIMDQVPETPDYVLQEAYYQAGRLVAANPEYKSLFDLFHKALCLDAAKADVGKFIGYHEEGQQAFGYGMIMPMMGHGVSWFDDHAKFPLKLPHFEWTYYDLDDKTYPIPEQST